mgnify:CR=1 FL=1
MDKHLVKHELNEAELLGTIKKLNELEHDDGVVQMLGSYDEILTYNFLVPKNDKTKLLSMIMIEVSKGRELSEYETKFLDEIDSRFIGHKDKKDFTPRETLCLFMKEYWDWDDYEWTNYRNVSVLVKDMFKVYTDFCKNNKIARRKRISYEDFKKYLSKYGNIKRYQKNNRNKITNVLVISNLPAYKESLTEIPDFDLSKHTELKQA